jgi:hypothetical protein
VSVAAFTGWSRITRTLDELVRHKQLPRDRIVAAVQCPELPADQFGEGVESMLFDIRQVFDWLAEHHREGWVDDWLELRDELRAAGLSDHAATTDGRRRKHETSCVNPRPR